MAGCNGQHLLQRLLTGAMRMAHIHHDLGFKLSSALPQNSIYAQILPALLNTL